MLEFDKVYKRFGELRSHFSVSEKVENDSTFWWKKRSHGDKQLFSIAVSHTQTGKSRPPAASRLFKVCSSLMWWCSCDAFLNASPGRAAKLYNYWVIRARRSDPLTHCCSVCLFIYLVGINLWRPRVQSANDSLIFQAWLWVWLWGCLVNHDKRL